MAEYANYYKDYPIVRKGDEIYYGYMGEPYVAMIQILHKSGEVADKVKIYQLSTAQNRVIQNAERDSLYEALDLAYTWLQRAMKA